MLPSQVIYVGLDIVTPLISLDLLKYPKLSRDVSPFECSLLVFAIEDNDDQILIFNLVSLQYFALMSHLLEVYPEKVAHLNRDAFTRIIGSLDFGLRNQACTVSKSAFTMFFFFYH